MFFSDSPVEPKSNIIFVSRNFSIHIIVPPSFLLDRGFIYYPFWLEHGLPSNAHLPLAGPLFNKHILGFALNINNDQRWPSGKPPDQPMGVATVAYSLPGPARSRAHYNQNY
jgi:hypothetical protein